MSETQPKLSALAAAARDLAVRIDGDDTVVVSSVSYDSRSVGEGDLFFCVPGLKTDGHEHAAEAVTAGARALVVQRPTGTGVPELVVTDVRAAMPLIAAAALGNPADELTLVGITGTNGKTTTAFLVESVLRADGRTPGLIGTIETHLGDEVRPGVRTTPESVDLQLLFAEMRDRGIDAVAMEVTSHALVLNRVDGIRFTAAAFTNLTQDHLDFHPTLEDYFIAKRSLFTPRRAACGSVNSDDPYGERIVEWAEIPIRTFGTTDAAEIRAVDVEMGAAGSVFTLETPDGGCKIETSLVGPFNVSNCLAAAAVSLQAGASIEAVEAGIRDLKAVPGRFEAIDMGQPFTVVVDYAHTPDSLDNVLVAARRLAASRGGRVIAVFGAGGDRDRSKRPLMGIAAARNADHVVVTSDNPRSEDPEAIIGEILHGVGTVRPEGPDAVYVDRKEAIEHAVSVAAERDVVVIAGKGHETGQQFADRTIPFDDRIVAREVLADRGWGG